MIIRLTERYRIYSMCPRNWTLQKLSTSKKTGELYWRGISYFGSLSHALTDALESPRFYLDIETKKECQEWLDKIKETSESITNKT